MVMPLAEFIGSYTQIGPIINSWSEVAETPIVETPLSYITLRMANGLTHLAKDELNEAHYS